MSAEMPGTATALRKLGGAGWGLGWMANMLLASARQRRRPRPSSLPSGGPWFRLRRLGDGGWTVTFGAAQGLLTYWVVQAEQLVVLLDLTWAG